MATATTLQQQLRKITALSALVAGVAVAAAGCANTNNPPGGGGVTDTGAAAQDTKAPADTATGSDAPATTDKGPGVDTPPTGSAKSISEIQQNPATLACDDSKIVNIAALKGISVSNVVVASPVWGFKSGAKDLQGVYVQTKGGGPWSGLYVVAEKADDRFAGVEVGSTVSIIGEVKEFYCLTELEPKVGVTIEPVPVEVPVAVTVDVDTLGAAKKDEHEQYEGVLMTVEGVVSEPLADIGTDGKPHSLAMGKTDADQTVLVGPGFGLYPQTKEGKANYQKGQKLQVIGFWDFSFKKFKITPLKITVLP